MKIPDSHRAEEFAKEMTKATQGVIRAHDQKYNQGPALAQSFAVAKKNNENLTYKKNGSRRRALTGREAAYAEDVAARRRIRVEAIEEERRKKHAEQIEIDKQRPKESRESLPEHHSVRDER